MLMNPLWLLKLKKYLPAILVVLALAGAVWWVVGALERADQRGYDRRGAIAQSDAARTRASIAEERVANAADAKVREDALSARLAQQKGRADAAQIALSGYLQKQAAKPYVQVPLLNENGTPNEAYQPPLLGQSVLDDFTVSLLDDARANRTRSQDGSAAGIGNGEVKAATPAAPPVTGGEFAENDLQVVGLYHDLAARHDQLVDWVNAQCLAQPAPTTK
jgi:hypothetical protein